MFSDFINNSQKEDQLYGNNLNDPYRTNTRFNYDPCRTIKRLEESTNVNRYIMNVPGNGSMPDVVLDPMIIGQRWSGNLMTNPVEVESALFGINRPINNRDLVKNVFEKYNVETQKVEYPINKWAFTTNSRADMPAWECRSMELNRWDMPLYNPQSNVCLPFQSYTDTRIISKQYYDKNRCIPML